MTESSSDPPDIASKRSRSLLKAHGGLRRSPPRPSTSPSPVRHETTATPSPPAATDSLNGRAALCSPAHDASSSDLARADDRSLSALSATIAAVPSSQHETKGSVVDGVATRDDSSNGTDTQQQDGASPAAAKRRGFVAEARRSCWLIATYSWVNVLLVFVPVGIVVAKVPGVPAGVVFTMNCVAVIPLAGLLSHATESVARNMGDSLGALLNVTFGNAVELIIL